MARETAIRVNEEELEKLQQAADSIMGAAAEEVPRGYLVGAVAEWVMDRRAEGAAAGVDEDVPGLAEPYIVAVCTECEWTGRAYPKHSTHDPISSAQSEANQHTSQNNHETKAVDVGGGW